MQWVNRIKPFIPPPLRRRIRTLLNRQLQSDWRSKEFARLWRSVGYKWALQSVMDEDDGLRICGWAIVPPEERARITFTCDDEPCQVEYPLSMPELANLYPYVPYSHESGFTCKIPLASPSDPRRDHFTLRCFDQSTRESPGHGNRPWYFLRRLVDDVLPEAERIFRVAGFRSADYFFLQGYNLFRQLDNALQKTVRRRLADFSQALDWGCGCGRIALHFRRLPSVRLTGVDIDSDNIRWCQENLSFGRFLTTPLHPPMPLELESFDLILGVSVFTHLGQEVAFQWLEELRRVAKKGAILLVTYHGDTALAIMGGNLSRQQFHALRQTGFLDLPNEQYDAQLDEKEYYRNILHQSSYINRHWSKYFEILDLIPSGVGIQDLAVCRRR